MLPHDHRANHDFADEKHLLVDLFHGQRTAGGAQKDLEAGDEQVRKDQAKGVGVRYFRQDDRIYRQPSDRHDNQKIDLLVQRQQRYPHEDQSYKQKKEDGPPQHQARRQGHL